MKKWAAKGIIKCPACGATYEYCHGLVNTPYFRHKDKTDCDRFPEPETEEHSLGKRNLYDWICRQDGVYDTILEGWLPETHQRPDIMFKHNGEQYVIEYQCSPIATEFIERHNLYQSGGIKDIWILGTHNYLNYANEKYNKDRVIEETAQVHYDSENNIALYSDTDILGEFTCLTNTCGFKDVFQSIRKYRFGLLRDKHVYACVSLDDIVFDSSIMPSVMFFNFAKNKLCEFHRQMNDLSEHISDTLFRKVSSRRVKWAYSECGNELKCKFKLINKLQTYSLNTLIISICKEHYNYIVRVSDKYSTLIYISAENIEALTDRVTFLDYQIIECLKEKNYNNLFKTRG